MIEQHGRGALQSDRIVETARRLDSVLDSIPHMSDLIEAIDDEPVAELPAVEKSVVTDSEVADVDSNASEGEPFEPDPEPESVAASPDEPEDEAPPTYRTGAEKRAAQAAEAKAEAEASSIAPPPE